jgi:hypothetical protein
MIMATNYDSAPRGIVRVPRAPDRERVSQPELAARRAVEARDAGLWRIGAATRWLLAGALGTTGALALLAAGTFSGHTLSTPPTTAQSANANAPATVGPSSQVAAPAQAPTSSAAAPVVVSGGS